MAELPLGLLTNCSFLVQETSLVEQHNNGVGSLLLSGVTSIFINGSIRKIEKTNISYIEPHKVIIKNITFLVFNYSNDVYISNLTKKIKLSELENYLKKL